MIRIPVISPHAGFLHLTTEQYRQFQDCGYIRFAEPPESFEFLSIPSDVAEAASMRIVKFDRIMCGNDIAAKADYSPYRIKTFVREQITPQTTKGR